MEKIIITPRSLSCGNPPVLSKLRDAGYELVFPSPGKQPSESELLAVIEEAVGYIAGVEAITEKILSNAKKLKIISRNGTGTDNIDLEAAAKRNIVIKKAEGANARGVAELTMGLVFAAARGISLSDRTLKAQKWQRLEGFELEGKVLGLVGCGKIGKLVAGFSLALGMKVLAYDSYPDTSFQPSPYFKYAPLFEILRDSDIVSLHCPPLPQKKALLGFSELSSMKKGALLINTARQSLVDERELVALLNAGHIAWYAIDAFDKEPPDDYALAQNERVIVTPHIGGFTKESIERASLVAIENLLSVLRKF